ncbi:hypothetical protein [Fibrobacter sp. UWH1]|uniref:hypothetical protein n=1 Tax=Fibrobacter sp. UWH1 TaxID=1964354 RepID=UPI000B524112|nr:hypothetical protein [Fibrobacter sp. UWH1]OWV13549.1 hypothetical protein B7992_08310 [Fibrobacter sp. UWH1]
MDENTEEYLDSLLFDDIEGLLFSEEYADSDDNASLISEIAESEIPSDCSTLDNIAVSPDENKNVNSESSIEKENVLKIDDGDDSFARELDSFAIEELRTSLGAFKEKKNSLIREGFETNTLRNSIDSAERTIFSSVNQEEKKIAGREVFFSGLFCDSLWNQGSLFGSKFNDFSLQENIGPESLGKIERICQRENRFAESLSQESVIFDAERANAKIRDSFVNESSDNTEEFHKESEVSPVMKKRMVSEDVEIIKVSKKSMLDARVLCETIVAKDKLRLAESCLKENNASINSGFVSVSKKDLLKSNLSERRTGKYDSSIKLDSAKVSKNSLLEMELRCESKIAIKESSLSECRKDEIDSSIKLDSAKVSKNSLLETELRRDSIISVKESKLSENETEKNSVFIRSESVKVSKNNFEMEAQRISVSVNQASIDTKSDKKNKTKEPLELKNKKRFDNNFSVAVELKVKSSDSINSKRESFSSVSITSSFRGLRGNANEKKTRMLISRDVKRFFSCDNMKNSFNQKKRLF